MTQSRRRIGRLLVELGVVVLGVLIALAADSWWQNREEASRELAYLEAIRADMIQTLDTLEVTMAFNSEKLARATGVYEGLSDRSKPDSLVVSFDFINFYPPSLATGTIDALIMSGSISLIRSEEVRAQVIRTAAAMDEGRELSRDLGGIAFQVTFELTQTVWPALSVVDGAGNRQPPTLGSLRDIPGAAPGLLGFASVLSNQEYWSGSARRAAEDLLAVVEQELDARGVRRSADVP